MFHIFSRNIFDENSLVAGIINLLLNCDSTLNVLILLPQIPLVETDPFILSRGNISAQLRQVFFAYLSRAASPSHCFILNGHLSSSQIFIKAFRSLFPIRIAEFQHGWVNGKKLFSSDSACRPDDFLTTDLPSTKFLQAAYPSVGSFCIGHFGLYTNLSYISPISSSDDLVSILLCQSKRDIELGYQSSDTILTPWSTEPLPLDIYPLVKELSLYSPISITIRQKPHTSFKDPNYQPQQSLSQDLLNSDLVLSPVSTVNIQAHALGIASVWFSNLLSPTSQALFEAYPTIPKINMPFQCVNEFLVYRDSISLLIKDLASDSFNSRYKRLKDESVAICERFLLYLDSTTS